MKRAMTTTNLLRASDFRHLRGWISVATLLILVLSLSLVLRADERAFNENQFYDLMGSMDRFERKLLGCPPRGYPPAIRCDARLGLIDMAEWREICRKARKLGGS